MPALLAAHAGTDVSRDRGEGGTGLAWHQRSAAAVLDALGSSGQGLSAAECLTRLERVGANELVRPAPIRPLRILVRQLRSFSVGLLLVAGGISAAVGDAIDAIAILAIVVINAVIGFFQEWSSERSIEALGRWTAPQARVRRAGVVQSIAARELVPGDVVLLEAGDRVPADLRLVQCSALRCSEATLTGESEPVEKTDSVLDADADVALGDRRNLAFLGTAVVAGAGSGVVIATGMESELGRIARLLSQGAESRTPLEIELAAVGRVLTGTCLAIVGLVAVLGAVRGLPAQELLMTSIGLAVAAVPEGLAAIATVALSLGVSRMARRRALVRRLSSIETLGCAEVVCSDKTGTLTTGEMTVREIWTGRQSFRVEGEGVAPVGAILHEGAVLTGAQEQLVRALLESVVSCNEAHLVRAPEAWAVVGDPTEGALLSAAGKLGIVQSELAARTPRVRHWPFDPARKRMSVARRMSQGLRVDAKGAPERILERCDRIADERGIRPLQLADRERIAQAQARLSEQALRVLAAAFRDVADPGALQGDTDPDVAERDLVFLGLIGMHDPVRPDAQVAVARCREAGIRVVMITGDHPATGLAVARELQIAGPVEAALTGAQIERMGDAELADRALVTAVYARVSAEHKVRIVRAWQARGAVTAMTGDGVNDAPALQAADIGVAMGARGTDVTKEAADIVITDDRFASIAAAIEEGRAVFLNIRKALQYLLAGNAAELMLMTASIAAGYPLPLLPVHLLWINLVTDGLPALCLATDPVQTDVMRQPPRPRGAAFVDRAFLSRVLGVGAIGATVAFCVYVRALEQEGLAVARSQVFSVLVISELLRAFSWRSAHGALWRVGLLQNRPLVLVVLLTLGLQLAIHQLELLRALFRTLPLDGPDALRILAAALLPVVVLELWKGVERWTASRRGDRCISTLGPAAR